MRALLLGATALLSCAAYKPRPPDPTKPPLPDECSSRPAYVAPPEDNREIAVNLSASLAEVMTLQRISLCVDGNLFWQINADLDTKVQNTLRLSPGPHHLQLVGQAARGGSDRFSRFEVRGQHALSESNVAALDIDLFLSGDATSPMVERPKLRWTEEPITHGPGVP